MSLSIIGALMALLPPSLLKTEAEIERLREEEERRDRELANAYSALAVEKLVSAHWRDEAKRLATQNRVDREMYERLIQQAHERFAQEPPHMRGAQQLQAQANMQMAQQAQYAQLGQYSQAQQGLHLFCNCVPGRHQVFEAERRRALMSEYQPAPVDDIVARLRP
jgi:hypothetical protein